ncbi:MAG: hypothetical protein JNL64_07935 [Blastocatellia bacterium]|nr:hypothetical protein [Blastocatellia bacterium]
MRSISYNILIFFTSLFLGVGIFNVFSVNESTGKALVLTNIEEPGNLDFDFDASNERHTYTCGDETGETNFKPVLKAWLAGVRFNEDIYCSETLKLAKAFSGANISLSEIDVNGDSQMELAIKTQCSMTGNCQLFIFQRSGKQAKQIFRDRNMTQLFGVSAKRNLGYSDIWTRDHGSWNSGGQVKYRFNGRSYVPNSCSDYEYQVTESADRKVAHTNEVATISPRPCSTMLAEFR